MFFFYSTAFSANLPKIMEKKKLNVELLNLLMYMKQTMRPTSKLKQPIIFLFLLINFTFCSFKGMVDKHVVHISLLMKKSSIPNILPGFNKLLKPGESIEKKHLIFKV